VVDVECKGVKFGFNYQGGNKKKKKKKKKKKVRRSRPVVYHQILASSFHGAGEGGRQASGRGRGVR
jgi:hypothetical protein